MQKWKKSDRVFAVVGVLYVGAIVFFYGLPSNLEEVFGTFVIPPVAIGFLALYYGGVSRFMTKDRRRPDNDGTPPQA